MAKKKIGPRTRAQWQRDQWYIKNRDLSKQRAMEHKHRDIEWFKETKFNDIQCGCSICGIKTNNPDDYDYHHRPDEIKISSVADMLGTYGRPKVIAEMKKCDIVCKECHRNIHDNLGNPHQARNPKTGRFMKHTL